MSSAVRSMSSRRPEREPRADMPPALLEEPVESARAAGAQCPEHPAQSGKRSVQGLACKRPVQHDGAVAVQADHRRQEHALAELRLGAEPGRLQDDVLERTVRLPRDDLGRPARVALFQVLLEVGRHRLDADRRPEVDREVAAQIRLAPEAREYAGAVSFRFGTAGQAGRDPEPEGGFTAEELRADHVFVAAYRRWLGQTDRWKELRLFDLAVTRQYRPQWSGEQILNCTINKQIALIRRPQDILILVTGVDLFLSKDLGFNFAVSGNRWSIVSYIRFLPWCTGEMPEWTKLVTRTRKQVLCSVGRSVGIAKCSSPRCVCSYANGLRDHDAKTEVCCPDCQARIDAAIRG